jgi:zinc protease
MTSFSRPARFLGFFLSLLLLAGPPVQAQLAPAAPSQALPPPTTLEPNDPWLYRGSDIPHDTEWKFGELKNGLRYAVRRNGVPPGQVSIRIRIDAGSLYEKPSEAGYAHLIEHLTFRQSKYLGNAEAIPTFQRLGASLGNDTNANTSPTQTVFSIDLPDAGPPKTNEAMKLLSGMIREPALSDANLATEVPIVLAEGREGQGPDRRVSDATRELYFAGQLIAEHPPIGTPVALKAATSASVHAFHDRWYRPENTLIVIAGDGSPDDFASLIERYFADWQVAGPHTPQPDFGAPHAPQGADKANPVGETRVLVEPSLPRAVTWAMLRPWHQVTDNLEYNRGLMIDLVAQQIINRRLESRARVGGSFLAAGVNTDKISRSTDGTFVTVTPLDDNWKQALDDVRAVIADALARPPSEDEITREVAEIDVGFANQEEQRINQAGAKLADDLVNAVDIRETVASPETQLELFRGMRARFTPEAVFAHTKSLFSGTVTRALYITPKAGEATAEDLKLALTAPVAPDGKARLASKPLDFADLPPIGTPQQPVSSHPVGIRDIEQLDFPNGVKALIWPTTFEPGRITVRVRFGAGYRAFTPADAPYIAIGQKALLPSGIGDLGPDELDRLATGRKLGFDFQIEDGVFAMEGETRPADLSGQLYLFAAKLANPGWDPSTFKRVKAAATLGYQSLSGDPQAVLGRDLEWLLSNRDPRYAVPTPAQLAKATPEGFRRVWEPLLKQGPVEVLVFGDIDEKATIEMLSKTFGAIPQRQPIPSQVLARPLGFPAPQAAPVVLYHKGDKDQAAAVVAWPTGGGVAGLQDAHRLDLLGDLFANRLLDAMREKAGASYSPQVGSTWPEDLSAGGRILALAQVPPAEVPEFFVAADKIAADLATTGPTEDELNRAVEPKRTLINRALSGHRYWMSLLEGATGDPRRITALGSFMTDYTEVTPEQIRQLAQKYLAGRAPYRIAVIPEGEKLATALPAPTVQAAK